MGVHGLSTYLVENYASISQRLLFSPASGPGSNATFIIDGWSFIYEVTTASGLPWVYGGEYAQFAQLVESVVNAWLNVGLEIHFVFDGPYPAVKFPTIVSRITRNSIQGSLLFFRTSVISRSRPRFLNEIFQLPPLSYVVCVETLKQLVQTREAEGDHPSLQIHFADEEGDPYSVELAARLEGYVVGNDSDFAILNAEGYKGYIPMHEMVWSSIGTDDDASHMEESDGGFQTVVTSKARKKAYQRQKVGITEGLIPPEGQTDLELSVTVYSPARLATHLQIPISLLPLLGALVGNDFTGGKDSSVTTSQQTNLQWLFFEKQLSLSQRIIRVAATLRSILDAALAPTAKGKQRVQVNSVMQLIERAVTMLMVRSAELVSSGERERIVERIVEATLQYAIPKSETGAGLSSLWSSPLCALHDEEACPLVRYLSDPSLPEASDSDSEADYTVRNMFIACYRAGGLDPRLLDVLHTSTFWYRSSLENPDLESTGRTFARPLHEFIYALLDDAFNLPEVKTDESEDEAEPDKDEEDDDSLIDVVEDDSDEEDPLAPLRGALQQLDDDVDDVKAAPSSAPVHSTLPRKRKLVTEYLRRGTRLAPEDIEVPPLKDICVHYGVPVSSVPIHLRAEDDRFTFFLRLLESDVASVRSLPAHSLLIILSVRWTVSRIALRAEQSSGSKERLKEMWAKAEARAWLASFTSSPTFDAESLPPVEDRTVQLVAQALNALLAILRLSQALFLQSRVPPPVAYFSGQLFHSFIAGTAPIPPTAVSAAMWDATVRGLDAAFADVDKRKRKKDIAPKTGLAQNGRYAGKGNVKGAGMFDLLAGMDA